MATRGAYLDASGVSAGSELGFSNAAKLEALIYEANEVEKVTCSFDHLLAGAQRLGMGRSDVLQGVNTLMDYAIINLVWVPIKGGKERCFAISEPDGATYHKDHAKSLYARLSTELRVQGPGLRQVPPSLRGPR